MTKAELLKAIGQTDRLIAKASVENVSDGYDGFNEDFLNYLDNEDVLDIYYENATASEDELCELLGIMQNYINNRKLNI